MYTKSRHNRDVILGIKQITHNSTYIFIRGKEDLDQRGVTVH